MTKRAPFPYPGGKQLAAKLVWHALGNVSNYVEPFAGSLAVLINRPTPAQTETVNDKDCLISNFWRAVQSDPEAVASHADWPVNEIDLHARNGWLINQLKDSDFRQQMADDPCFFDAKIAGWWVWGISCWIGRGWSASLWRQLPHLGDKGNGVHRPGIGSLLDYFQDIQARLRHVRVACGDWRRVVTPAVTTRHGLTGIFLDPPYTGYESLYSEDNDIAADVASWAIEHGDDPALRIVLASYDGQHEMPSNWRQVAWTANGGHGNRSASNINRHAERLYLSPHCLHHGQQATFDI